MRPGFRPAFSKREPTVMQQRGQDLRPASMENGDQTPTRPTAALGMWHVVHRFHRQLRIGLPADRQQPPRRDGHRQPQSFGSCWVVHARVLPLPTTAFDPLESLLDPGPQTIPTNLGCLGRQVRQDQPRIGISFVPTSEQGAFQLGVTGIPQRRGDSLQSLG